MRYKSPVICLICLACDMSYVTWAYEHMSHNMSTNALVCAPSYNRVRTYLKSLSSSLPHSTHCQRIFIIRNYIMTSLMATSIKKRSTYVPVGAASGPPVKTCFVCEIEFATHTQPLEHWGYRTCRRCRRNNIEFCSVYCRMVDHDNFINIAPCNQCQAISDQDKQ